MAELINKPYPIDGEALQSFICRIARANHYSFHQLSQYYVENAARLRSYDFDDRKRICQKTQELCGNVKTENLIDIWSFYRNYKELLDFSKTKICVDCYQDNHESIQAKFWSKHIVTCSKHNKLLIDSCSKCDAEITFQTITDGKCTNCNLPLSKIHAADVKPDMISERLSEAFSKVNSSSDFEQKLVEHSYPTLNKIKLLIPLVNVRELSEDKFWKRRRSLSISELHQYQSAISKLLINQNELNEALLGYIKDALSRGSLLVNSTKAFTRLQHEVGTEFFFESLKRILNELFEEYPDTSVSVVWIESLFDIEESSFYTFIGESFPTKFCDGTQKTVFLRDLQTLLTAFKNEFK